MNEPRKLGSGYVISYGCGSGMDMEMVTFGACNNKIDEQHLTGPLDGILL